MTSKSNFNVEKLDRTARRGFHWSVHGRQVKRKIVFLTLEHYSFIAVANAIEPLRAANWVEGRQVYEWVIATMDGSTSAASNGISMSPTVSINAVEDAAIVFVCGGLEIEKAATPALIAKLKQFDEDRIPLGSLCTGGYCLAVAGLLNRYEAVVHWEQKVP